jgi:hypothetical protein
MKRTRFLFLVVAGSLAWSAWSHRPEALHDAGNPYHSGVFRSAYGGLPDTSNALFTGSGKCAGCHGTDANHYASIAGQTFPAVPMPDGWNVNVTDDWRSSLMANSAKDPFWRAKVEQEVALNPGHQLELEDKCTACHAPLGNFAAEHEGQEFYSMAELLLDSLALDGVSCNACHQQAAPGIGTRFSGEMTFVEDTLYGPYGGGKDEPLIYNLPMNTYVGYEPVYGAHMQQSEACAACHSLITETADLDGNFTGGEFVEQSTYHEWLNSRYAPDVWEGEMNDLQQECQGCHMPQIDEPVIISSGYAFLEPRTPYGLHYFVGANAAMLRLLRDHVDELGLTASEAQFDSTKQRTLDLLQQHSVDLTASATYNGQGAAEVVVDVVNKAGHKFPSGYPARRAWLEVEVRHPETNEVLWASGERTADGLEIAGVDEAGLTTWEPHLDVVTSEDEVQIYEMVIADVTGAPTNVLERADTKLKDNRLVPLGFSMEHSVYDTTTLAGTEVLDDAMNGNFNRDASGTTGTGADRVTYQADFSTAYTGAEAPLVSVRMWYQSMPPRWVNPMFEVEGEAIDWFEGVFLDYAHPDLVAEVTPEVAVVGVAEMTADAGRIWPVPSVDGQITIASPFPKGAVYEVYDALGQRVQAGATPSTQFMLRLPVTKQVYTVVIHHGGQRWIGRAIRG